MIEDLQISGHTVSYTFDSFRCQYIVLGEPNYYAMLRMLEEEAREVHESRMVDFNEERKQDFR